jgi:hypothetical protein
VFFPDQHGNYRAAREVCHGCPVIADCRAFCDRAERGTPAGFLFGFYASETPSERVERRRSRH